MSGVPITMDLENVTMDKLQSENVHVVIKTVGNDGIMIQDTKKFIKKGEVKTTGYFLNVDQDTTEENDNAQFLPVESENEENQETQFVTMEVGDAGQLILHNKDVIIYDELCRICANASDRFIPIFNDEGLEHNLQEKIHAYLPLQVSENDSLPLQVCYNCAATLLSWHELYKGCLDSQQRLLELQSKLNSKDQYYNDSTVEEENIENVLEIETTNNDEVQADGKNENCMETMQIVTASDLDRSHHQRDCTSFKEFQKSFKPTLPIVKNRKVSQPSSKPVKKRATRTIKTKSLKRLSKMKAKAKNNDSTPNKALENSENLTFVDVNSLKSMVKEADSNNDNDDNDDDDETEDRNYEMDEDALASPTETSKPKKKSRRNRNAVGLECTQCNKKFRMYNSYQIHMRIHTGEKPYTCHICGKQFSQTGSLYYHLKHVHAGIKNHACDICGRCFAMKTAMEDHRRIHTGERPYVCDSCGKTFKTKASLYIHSKIHTNEYPFKCSYCKKLFRWKQQMISHLTTHTGEKNHICDICGKGFGVKNELTRHRRTHSLDKPFTCQKCGVSFGQKRYLTNHNRTRHKTKVETSTS